MTRAVAICWDRTASSSLDAVGSLARFHGAVCSRCGGVPLGGGSESVALGVCR